MKNEKMALDRAYDDLCCFLDDHMENPPFVPYLNYRDISKKDKKVLKRIMKALINKGKYLENYIP